MTNKYDHLFVSGLDPEIQKHRPYTGIGFLDGRDFAGCYDYKAFWIGQKPYGPYGSVSWGEIYHGPHVHKDPDISIWLGTDPENPMDLGAEVEMCVGPEMEKHLITRSTIVYMPADFPHFPMRIMKVNRPFLLIAAFQAGSYNEKALRDYIPAEDRDRMIFVDEGFEDQGIKPGFDWPAKAGPNPHQGDS